MNPLDISPDQFRKLAQQATDLAAEYLQNIDTRSIMPKVTGAASEQAFHTMLPEKGMGEEALADLQNVIAQGRAINGRFFGYVLGSGDPVGGVADLLASVLNQNVTAWRSSPAAVTIERTVIGWLAESIGCKGFSGSLAGGGSAANLMGLAMAREAKVAANEKGVSSRGVVYASEEVHMSIPKAMALLGVGRENLRLIRTDESFRMDPSALDQAIRRDKEAGRVPFAVVASAGTVNTGAIDPLTAVAQVAKQHDLWVHVDGAYGAFAAIANPNKFAGLDLAASLSLDAHKWLYQPLDCGCLLYRDPAAARKAFAYTGDYTKALSNDPVEGFAFFEETIELSRRFRALKVWLALRYHGLETFRAAIQRDLANARRLAEAIVEEPQLQLVAPVELSAVCFRYLGGGGHSESDLNRLNPQVLKRVNERGKIYLSNATLRAKFCLRACIINPRTTDGDIAAVVPEVLEAAKGVLS
jgi:glutamate/tyrosine decarboxylase-like PLP-dependent enzyme